MKIEYVLKSFGELTTIELYQVLKLRNEIFIVEQKCAYQDIDDKDLKSHHLMCLIDGKLAGYTRIVPSGISYNEASIGRVAIGSSFRGLSLGKQLMEKSINACEELYEKTSIRIGAQLYLLKFYNSLGFQETGESYDEDGIEHMEMVLN
jgi:ElaA protein